MPEQVVPLAGVAGQFSPTLDSPRRSACLRFVGFFALWLVLMQSVKSYDLIFGVCVAITATWASLRLLPPAAGSVRFTGLLRLLPHFLWQSVRAGTDVARRALSPRVTLHPGLVTCSLELPPGQARNTFAAITSLLPGTVPCDDTADALVYHCLDTSQPVTEQVREEERRLALALVAGRSHV